MSLYKRTNIWWYKFQWQGKLIRESTKQRNDKVARQMEAAHRTSLAKGEVGIREKKRVLTLAEFSKGRFEPWVESTSTAKTWSGFYRVGLLAINNYAPLANLPLDSITGESISGFASHQQARGLQISSVNSSLRILRRLLRVAMEWGELHTGTVMGTVSKSGIPTENSNSSYLRRTMCSYDGGQCRTRTCDLLLVRQAL